MPADRIRQHRALTDEKLPTAMQHQARLLLFRFCWHEPHRRSSHRLTDRSSIIRVILAALEVSLHIVRRHQPHRMAECLKLAAPMMYGRTRLNTNEAWRQCSEKLRHLSAAYPPADHHCAIDIHAVDLKDRLRNIETNCANFAHGRLPSSWFASTQPPYGTLMPQSGRRPQHHSRPMQSVPVPINVRCYSNSNMIVRRSEVTLRARSGLPSLWSDCPEIGRFFPRTGAEIWKRRELSATLRPFLRPTWLDTVGLW